MKNNRTVIDTNVFISALIGQYSFPYKIFSELVATGEIQLCLSDELLSEYQNVSQRDKFNKHKGFSEKAQALIAIIESTSIKFNPVKRLDIIQDEDDNRILELAVESNAAYIVTGNTNDFNFLEYQGIKILSPKEFYLLMTDH